MKNQLNYLKIGDRLHGFLLEKKESVPSQKAELYTFKHEKTAATLFYLDRDEENKTFSVSFKTLPEDDTGVFHILEHSVLNGSKKYPVKEPFVSMLQSSMQTFLNAMTYPDKTVFPVSSRNERDFFNLMSVYLDAVFCPLIYERPEIFMQEGWHFEFEDENSEPYYNGVVFSEMKGAYSDVERIIYSEASKLIYKDSCYGFSSGGDPKHITDLTYEQFVATHKRFYHPSNSIIFLDGNLDADAALEIIDGEYLSKYEYKKPDFDFVLEEEGEATEATVYYEAREEEAELSHMCATKLLCTTEDTEKNYAARILADYLTGSNEAPLKKAFLEKGLCQDVVFELNDGIYQPSVMLTFKNASKDSFGEIKNLISECAARFLKDGFNKEALSASLEQIAFTDKEISEPYGLELGLKILDSALYGGDPLVNIENAGLFDALRSKINTNYFEELFFELYGNAEKVSYLYVLPSLTKGEDDAKEEEERLEAVVSSWTAEKRSEQLEAFCKMQEWQQSPDTEEALSTLPHLDLKDIPLESVFCETEEKTVCGTKALKVNTNTNGIGYLDLYFDVSDFSIEELRLLKILIVCIGELATKNYTAEDLQTKIKAVFGRVAGDVEIVSHLGELKECKPMLKMSFSMLEKNTDKAPELIKELLLNGKYDETDKIGDLIVQFDYRLRQSLIGNGHSFAMKKALSAFSAENALKELLEGESFVTENSRFVAEFKNNKKEACEQLEALAKKAFAKNRLFVSFCGDIEDGVIEEIVKELPENEMGSTLSVALPGKEDCTVEIPASVGYSAIGGNLYGISAKPDGAWLVLSSLMTYGYLWNAVRVRGGAYGTGMRVRLGGDAFCYSYRDPNPKGTKEAYLDMPAFLEDFLKEEQPIDDIIIGTVNSTEPLSEPSEVLETETVRFFKGITHENINTLRKEILKSTPADLKAHLPVLQKLLDESKLCVVGDKATVEEFKN